MRIRERSNLLYVYLEEEENINEKIDEIIRTYKIIEGRITGSGFFKRIEYGVLQKSEPLFFNKKLSEELITVSAMEGFIDNRDYKINITAYDSNFSSMGGRLINGIVTNEFIFMLYIYKTE